MNLQKENINRLKEVFLLVLFFVFIFSFSGKSLGRSTEHQKTKTSVDLVSYPAKSTVTRSVTFKAPHASPVIIKTFLIHEHCLKIRATDHKINCTFHFLKQNFLRIKPQISYVATFMTCAMKKGFTDLL